MNQAFADNFWAQTLQRDEDSCWLWLGKTLPGGYGWVSKRQGQGAEYTHRISWEIFNGPISDGLWVLHRCDVPGCVNPNHLFLGTALDNNRDTREKGRHHLASRTHCHRGHPLSGENVRREGVARRCKTCRRAYNHCRKHVSGNTIACVERMLSDV